MSGTENMKADLSLLDVIRMLAFHGETGQLEIRAAATSGTFSFQDGKLVDAQMGSLKGFQAVNAAVSLRDAHFSFDPSIPPLSVNSFPRNERIVLKRFFGIETVETLPKDVVPTNEVDWDLTPSQVVPLSEVAEFNGGDSEELPTIDVEQVPAFMSDQVPTLPEQIVRNDADDLRVTTTKRLLTTDKSPSDELSATGTNDSIRENDRLLSVAEDNTLIKRKAPNSSVVRDTVPYAVLPTSAARHRFAIYVMILLLLTAAGTFALVRRLSERRQATLVAKSIDSASLPAAESNSNPRAVDSPAVVIPAPPGKQVSSASPSAVLSEPQNKRSSNLPSLSASEPQVSKPEPESSSTHDLTGEWKIVNTVHTTRYRPFNNLEIGFRLVISQTGKEFTAKGEKISENGQALPRSGRTPIHVTGLIEGDRVQATFFEQGSARKTNGRFVWRIQNSGAGLRGTFASTAAGSRGTSAATKEL